MTYTEYMTVKNNLIVDTKFGRRRVINLKNRKGGDEAIWIEQLDAMSHIKAKQQVEVIRGVKGGLTILERDIPRNQNGNGLKPVSETLPDVLADIDLPELMSEEDKKRLARIIKERAKLLTYTIEVMREELNDKGLEFHEGSIRSLSVSLFIHISKFID